MHLINRYVIFIQKPEKRRKIFLPDFNLTDDDIQKLKRRFDLFQKEREIIHKLLNDYIVDYRQYSGRAAERYEYLREKYISQSPNLSHLIFNDGNILWSLNDIAIVLGRHLTSIIRTFDKIEITEGYCAKLIALRETVKAKNGHNIPVYHKEIFDLIIDFYEYEYLLRFSEPRRGDKDNAPDIDEIKRFWTYLKDFYNYNNFDENGIALVIYAGADRTSLYMGKYGPLKGEVFTAYSDKAMKEILKYVYENHLATQDYVGACETYIKLVDGFYVKSFGDYRVGEEKEKTSFPWIEILIVSTALSFIIVVLVYTKYQKPPRYGDITVKNALNDTSMIVKCEYDKPVTEKVQNNKQDNP